MITSRLPDGRGTTPSSSQRILDWQAMTLVHLRESIDDRAAAMHPSRVTGQLLDAEIVVRQVESLSASEGRARCGRRSAVGSLITPGLARRRVLDWPPSGYRRNHWLCAGCSACMASANGHCAFWQPNSACGHHCRKIFAKSITEFERALVIHACGTQLDVHGVHLAKVHSLGVDRGLADLVLLGRLDDPSA